MWVPADIIPVVMAGIIGIYGLVVSVLISSGLQQVVSLYTGFIQLGAGLSVGLAGLAAGMLTSTLTGHTTSKANSPVQVSLLVLSVMLVSAVLPSNPGSSSE